jgi:hypothetical protein
MNISADSLKDYLDSLDLIDYKLTINYDDIDTTTFGNRVRSYRPGRRSIDLSIRFYVDGRRKDIDLAFTGIATDVTIDCNNNTGVQIGTVAFNISEEKLLEELPSFMARLGIRLKKQKSWVESLEI